MQTFLPYSDFIDSAKALDWRRLGKQRVETWQILRALTGESKGWINHPAVKMWRGYEGCLARYGTCMCREWIARGYNDTMLTRFTEYLRATGGHTYPQPPWLGRVDFHLAHRSNLVRKDAVFYGIQWPDVPPDLPYVWPVPLNERKEQAEDAASRESQSSA